MLLLLLLVAPFALGEGKKSMISLSSFLIWSTSFEPCVHLLKNFSLTTFSIRLFEAVWFWCPLFRQLEHYGEIEHNLFFTFDVPPSVWLYPNFEDYHFYSVWFVFVLCEKFTNHPGERTNMPDMGEGLTALTQLQRPGGEFLQVFALIT